METARGDVDDERELQRPTENATWSRLVWCLVSATDASTVRRTSLRAGRHLCAEGEVSRLPNVEKRRWNAAGNHAAAGEAKFLNNRQLSMSCRVERHVPAHLDSHNRSQSVRQIKQKGKSHWFANERRMQTKSNPVRQWSTPTVISSCPSGTGACMSAPTTRPRRPTRLMFPTIGRRSRWASPIVL